MTEPRATRQSGIYSPDVIEDIQTKAELGRYRIRGFGTLRTRPMPTLDDLVFIPCTLTRIPLEGYREKCSTRTVLGTRHAKKPIVLDTPVMVTGMSYGALSYNAKVALAQGASRVGSSTTTGDGGMLPAEREHSKILIYEVLPSRYGIDVHHMKVADGIELTIGQGAKPGTGGMLLGSKVSSEIAGMRDLPDGVDQRSPCRHPDFLGPDDMIIKIEELREATDWQVPIFVKMGATRVYDDVKLAAKAGADVVVVDGMEGGTGALARHAHGPHRYPHAGRGLRGPRRPRGPGAFRGRPVDHGRGNPQRHRRGQGPGPGRRRHLHGTAFLIALNCNKPIFVEDYHELGTEPYACHHCHTGLCPVGITTQDPDLMARLPIDEATERVANFFQAMNSEIQMLARACGKSDIHDLDPEDLRALTLESSMIAGVPLVGTRRVFGGGAGWKESH